MFESYDNDELLAFVEGTLDHTDAARANTLRAELESNPQAAHMLASMAADRIALQELPELTPSRDIAGDAWREFDAAADMLAARPVLIDTNPGSYRRQHNQASRRRRLQLQLAAAACVTFVVGGGIWGLNELMSGNGTPDGTGEHTLAANDDNETDSNRDTFDNGASSDLDGALALEDGEQHHLLQPFDDGDDADNTSGNVHTAMPLLASSFALVMPGADDDAAETSLTASMTALADEQRMALVQNFNLDEARALANAWERARLESNGDVSSHAAASIGDHRFSDLANKALQQRRHNSRLPRPAIDDRNTVFGNLDLAPSYEEQLELSEMGATFTVVVRFGDLDDVLAKLAAERGSLHFTDLHVENDADGNRPVTSGRWATRAMMQRLIVAHPNVDDDTLIELPVVLGR